MANPSNDKGGSPAPPRRSRTKRDPSGDKVYSVPPQDFADTVQRLTGAATGQSQQAPAPVVAGAAADGAPSWRRSSSSGSPPPAAPALLSVSTARSRSMQEAYLAWCASNNVVLSPGTMAEMMERGAQS
ncbi:hypothetical protein BDA96_01G303000 [Sorghum bicolor]|uniref:VQ domain-containing protein n=2 Tax=Sorghum bicolor TaxID=4558 RepID=A0A921S156_SORBI|nr:hypothetical protein BDA96_01G303000 [Sorghum bicolor]OQU92046.1 hypothetical protein SORBI_3001G279701 [Sorghum bicolor]